MSETTRAAEERSSALSIRNYRLFFAGQSLSNVGTWFQVLAQALLVLKLTGKASSLGEVFAAQTVPLLVAGPFIGSFLDRANLRRVFLIVSAFAGLEAFALSLLVETHEVSVGWILGLSFLLGIAQMFNQPTNQAFIRELVPPSALASGVALNSVQQSIGRLAGPAIAALLYAWKGAATCYFVNGVSYVIVVIAVILMRRATMYPRAHLDRSPGQLADAFRFVWQSRLHRDQLIANMVIGCLAMNFPIFYSSFTQLVLHSGSASFGIAESINAVFAVIGGVVISKKIRRPMRGSYVIGCLALGCSLVLTSAAPNLVVFYCDMVLFGFAVVTYGTIGQVILQQNTPPSRVGSVMTLYVYGNQGMTPIGSLVTGWLIGIGTARTAIAVGGASALLCALVLGISMWRAGAPAVSPGLAEGATP